MNHNIRFIIVFFALSLLIPSSIFAQAGYSSAAFSMGKQRAETSVVPAPEEVIVEEYINYHRHDLPLPKGKEAIEMELRWGNDKVSALLDEAVLQIGLTTRRMEDLSDMQPVNVSLVIDKSGSMQGEKLAKTKDALRAFVKKLRPNDKVSLVAFDDVAYTVLAAQKVGNGKVLKQAISSIQVGGSTNLHDGLLNGYREILKNYAPLQTNRIIMLTDAITNTGIIDPEQIISKTDEYKAEYTIDFVVIGVGVDFNYGLSRQLTRSQKSQIHFVNDPADIEKVFVEEAEALLAPVAQNVALVIEHAGDLELEHLYGYSPRFEKFKIIIDLDNINAGLTQVILLKFKAGTTKFHPFKNNIPVRVTLTYDDIRSQQTETLAQSKALQFGMTVPLPSDLLKDQKVKKNYLIAQMAQSLQDMAKLYAKMKVAEAQTLVDGMIAEVQTEQAFANDADVKRVLDILAAYSSQLAVK